MLALRFLTFLCSLKPEAISFLSKLKSSLLWVKTEAEASNTAPHQQCNLKKCHKYWSVLKLKPEMCMTGVSKGAVLLF